MNSIDSLKLAIWNAQLIVEPEKKHCPFTIFKHIHDKLTDPIKIFNHFNNFQFHIHQKADDVWHDIIIGKGYPIYITATISKSSSGLYYYYYELKLTESDKDKIIQAIRNIE